MKENDRVFVSGSADDLWIDGYGSVSVASTGILMETPAKKAKKVLVQLNYIDGDANVTVRVRKDKIIPIG